MTYLRTYGTLVIGALALLVVAFSLGSTKTEASGGTDITGYAWSDTVGWIDLNCSNSSSCGTNNWGLTVASNGTVSGYAWSDNIGWISANSADVSGCPSSPCTPTISHGAMTGWLKALSADGNGWDGWISLSGSGYGPTLGSGSFTGYAWGSTVVGWVDWSLAHSSYAQCTASYSCSGLSIIHTDSQCNTTTVTTCVSPNFCSAGSSTCISAPPSFNQSSGLTGHLQAVPTLLPQNTTAKLFWNVSNVTSCTVTGSNGNHWTGAASPGGGQVTSALTQQTSFTLACTGADASTISETVVINILPVFQER